MATNPKKPGWKDRVWYILGIEGQAWGEEAKSKTIHFHEDGHQTPISSRQYVLFADPQDAHVKDIADRLGRAWRPEERVGLWVPAAWDKEQMLVLRGALSAEGKSKKPDTPPSFEVVGLVVLRDSTQAPGPARYDVVADPRAVRERVYPFLVIDDCSRPPQPLAPPGAEARGRADPGALVASAEALWLARLGKDVAAATLSCFLLKFPPFRLPGARACLARCTRLRDVVEREDWCKIAVFCAPAWERADALCADPRELAAVARLPFVRLALLSNVDNDRAAAAAHGLALVPAFRLWRYAIYLLLVARAGACHRFFVARHCPRAPWLFAYDPARDSLALAPVPPALLDRHFYYIVPYTPEQHPRVPIFSSLSELRDRILPSTTPPTPSS